MEPELRPTSSCPVLPALEQGSWWPLWPLICCFTCSSEGGQPGGRRGAPRHPVGAAQPDASRQQTRVLRAATGVARQEQSLGTPPRCTATSRAPLWLDRGPWQGASQPPPIVQEGRSPCLPLTMSRGPMSKPGRPKAALVTYTQRLLLSCYKWPLLLNAPTGEALPCLVHLKDHSSPPQFINQGGWLAACHDEVEEPRST